MEQWLELATVLLFLTNLVMLGSSELGGCIRVVAIQGILLGLFTLIARADALTLRLVLLGVVSMGLKGFVFPFLLARDIREANVRREVEPFVGYAASIAIGLAMLAVSMWITARFPEFSPTSSSFVIPVALSTVFTGLFLLSAGAKRSLKSSGIWYLKTGFICSAFSQQARSPSWLNSEYCWMFSLPCLSWESQSTASTVSLIILILTSSVR